MIFLTYSFTSCTLKLMSNKQFHKRTTTWVLTDGKIGDRVQCLGIAKALGTPFEERVIMPTRPWSWFMPYGPVPLHHRPDQETSPIAPPFPELIIASGRRTVSYIRTLKKHMPKNVAVVFLKDPRTSYHLFDAVWSPSHDQVNQPNHFATLTSPHGITRDDLQQQRNTPPSFIDSLPGPRIGIILGDLWTGIHRKNIKTAVLDDFIKKLNSLKCHAGSFIITPSRRTPSEVYNTIRSAVNDFPHWAWQETGENPYVSILAHSDALVVTGDSHNMVSESLLSGCPVMVYQTTHLKKKMHCFLDELHEESLITFFDGTLSQKSHRPISATEEIAAFIQQKIAPKVDLNTD